MRPQGTPDRLEKLSARRPDKTDTRLTRRPPSPGAVADATTQACTAHRRRGCRADLTSHRRALRALGSLAPRRRRACTAPLRSRPWAGQPRATSIAVLGETKQTHRIIFASAAQPVASRSRACERAACAAAEVGGCARAWLVVTRTWSGSCDSSRKHNYNQHAAITGQNTSPNARRVYHHRHSGAGMHRLATAGGGVESGCMLDDPRVRHDVLQTKAVRGREPQQALNEVPRLGRYLWRTTAASCRER